MSHRQSNEPKQPPGDWTHKANCLGLPSSLFFPERATSGTGEPQVRAVCAGCCVKRECLDYAMTEPVEMTGWWGGTSPRERFRMRRLRRLRGAS